MSSDTHCRLKMPEASAVISGQHTHRDLTPIVRLNVSSLPYFDEYKLRNSVKEHIVHSFKTIIIKSNLR